VAKKPKSYPSDVTHEEWAIVAPYLTRMGVEVPQHAHSLCDIFNALRWMARGDYDGSTRRQRSKKHAAVDTL